MSHWNDGFGRDSDQRGGLDEALVRPAELVAQRAQDFGANRIGNDYLLTGFPAGLGDEPGNIRLSQSEFVGPLLAVFLKAIQLAQGQVRRQSILRDLVSGLALGLR